MNVTHYFAADGSYGPAELVIIDTTDWTDEEWMAIDNARESERMSIAWQLANGVDLDSDQDTLPGI